MNISKRLSLPNAGRYLFALCVLLVTGCLEPYVPSVITIDYNFLVVDGFLVSNDSTFIKLSRSQTIGDPTAFEAERQAHVEVQGEDGTQYTLTEKPKGVYVAPPLNLTLNSNYRLYIRAGDTKEYFSDFVPLKQSPPLDSVTWKETPELDAVQFNVFAHDPENKTRYYFWRTDETWQYESLYGSIFYYENGQVLPRERANELRTCWKTAPTNNIYLNSTTTLSDDIISDFKLLEIPQNSIKLYFGYSLLVKQYALSTEAYDYWTQIKKSSESLGTLFDPIPAQPFSNIRCITDPTEPVIGHFSATTVQKARVFFTRQQITGPSSPYGPTGYEDCSGGLIPPEQISAASLKGKLIIKKEFDKVTFEFIGYAVGRADCVDCRLKGGVNTPPDYWK